MFFKHLVALLLFCGVASGWQVAPGSMLTEWGAEVRPENAWCEYPRPGMERARWTNLNGLWAHAITAAADEAAPAEWAGEILVPFCVESALSGVKRRITAADALWYRRNLEFTPDPANPRVLLNFEAVDYKTSVWINETRVGSHTGGNLPFSFDITESLKPGTNTLTVKVTDATDAKGSYQLHGKQRTQPKGIFYTPVSGIWQTVWMEQVPSTRVTSLSIVPRVDGTIALSAQTTGGAQELTVDAFLAGTRVATASGPAGKVRLKIPDPKLWSPDSPTLYDLEVRYGDDKVRSYVGLRETTVIKDAEGHFRFALNGKPIFHWGTLDQGWWPDGLLTPPSEAAMVSDIDFLKQSGFNTIRKHIKVEPRRYYAYCDRVGMLVWQDQVSGSGSPPWTRLQVSPADAEWPEAAHQQFMLELRTMVDLLGNHPCIVQWVPFNEAWGQHRTMEVGDWLVRHDPTRQVNIASGGNFYPVGHIVDAHDYPHPQFPFEQGAGGRFDGYVKVMGEFGGHGFPVAGHLWDPKAANWGYGGLPKDKVEWLERYQTSLQRLAELRKKGISAGIYTQTTDVEEEINGLLTYDRKVRKVEPAALLEMRERAGLMEP